MRILLSNDDGVSAPGLQALSTQLAALAEIEIVAPDRDRSGASNSLTLKQPLRIKEIDDHVTSVEGTPTDCVHLALMSLLETPPDMVVSGINRGANLGDDVLYSGTVAAAIEGRFLGLPAIAISLCHAPENLRLGAPKKPLSHYETAAQVAHKLVQQLQKDPLPAGTILNVNVPDCPWSALTGWSVTRLGARHGAKPSLKTQDPYGSDIYWIGPPSSEQDNGPGTDFHAIRMRSVSITPLQTDLTNYASFEQLSCWLNAVS